LDEERRLIPESAALEALINEIRIPVARPPRLQKLLMFTI